MTPGYSKGDYVLIIEPAYAGYALIPTAKRLGLEVAVLTAGCDDRVIPSDYLSQIDCLVRVDTNNDRAVLAAASALTDKHQIRAVLPGFEYYVPITADVATLLGCPGLDPHAARAVRYKDRMRAVLRNAGITVPLFAVIEHEDELYAASREIGFPCVAKPIDAAGSIGVKKVESYKELAEIFGLIVKRGIIDFGKRRAPNMIVESYIAGKEFSIEGFVKDGAVTFFGVTEKFLSLEPYFVELGHIVNAPVSDATRDIMERYVRRVLEALCVNIGPFHAEVRLSNLGPVLMEVAARLPGDKICDLWRFALGIDLCETMILAYLGEPIQVQRRLQARYAGIRYFLRPGLKSIARIEGGLDVASCSSLTEIRIYETIGTKVPETVDFLHRFGHAIVVDDDYDRVRDTLNWIDSSIIIA